MYGFKYVLLIPLLSMSLHNKVLEMVFSKVILEGSVQNLVYSLTQQRLESENNFRSEISELFPIFNFISYSTKLQSAKLVPKLLIVLLCEKMYILQRGIYYIESSIY